MRGRLVQMMKIIWIEKRKVLCSLHRTTGFITAGYMVTADERHVLQKSNTRPANFGIYLLNNKHIINTVYAKRGTLFNDFSELKKWLILLVGNLLCIVQAYSQMNVSFWIVKNVKPHTQKVTAGAT